MSYIQSLFPITAKKELAPGIFDYTVYCPPIASQAAAGQFVHIRADGFTLRRPISLCQIDRQRQTIRLVFEVRGGGTQEMSHLSVGDSMDILGPLGNGFPLLSPENKVIVVGGGIGVPPMVETAAHYGKNATAIIGFRNSQAVILKSDFESLGCDTRLATDDGSAGYHGFVSGLLKERLEQGPADLICACGPMPMLKSVVSIAQQANVPTKVSLEERMGCGVGACLVCACRTVRDGKEIFTHVCKDGPVFDGDEVVF
ncbi:dihydroorotate dehydrogenase electron transfer subunit [Youxingia wuxianensis]|uniref:Dihydroorotate dehydrogenase B (NAD(+)), electron transfer subunit n=1 Tax=Youxingia wuxianensis TaxID=2763678 RepID=A0A926ENT3_9FIRM|nr:dihydroorotate dehydrogenase electron transfer subunit [Youxingia wuxianensis]MBC8586016.1 dihydroorotate dehydrogenase electron transfer subunit [Youxingia wuxianensis]